MEGNTTASSTVTAGNTSSFTCSTCRAIFNDSNAHREHYKQDWHKYNLKRKIAGLPIVTESEFNKYYNHKDEDNENEKITSWNCEACKKSFNSENAYKNHELSKKHIENIALYKNNKHTVDRDEDGSDLSDDNDSKKPKINWKKRFAEAKTEEEFNKILEEKIKLSRKIEETECLFCNFKGNTFEEKMEHMTVEHTFFVPDIEYLTDLKGLMNYLSEKIAIGNVCIYCEKSFHSLEAVRKHMLAKGHTKISYEEGPDLEIANFYDFSFLDDEDEENNDENDEITNDEECKALTVTSEGTELILPSGAHIGHRDYKRYYNQNLRGHDESNSKALMTLSEKYKALGYYEIGSSGMTIEKERLEKMKAARIELKKYSRNRQTMGQKQNNFFDPIGRNGQFEKYFLR